MDRLWTRFFVLSCHRSAEHQEPAPRWGDFTPNPAFLETLYDVEYLVPTAAEGGSQLNPMYHCGRHFIIFCCTLLVFIIRGMKKILDTRAVP